MDNDYVKLGLSLVVLGGGIKKKLFVILQVKFDGVIVIVVDEEEDEYLGGLCQYFVC